jgi:hypothetical protein
MTCVALTTSLRDTPLTMVPSSSGKDNTLSQCRHGFDSRWDYNQM